MRRWNHRWRNVICIHAHTVTNVLKQRDGECNVILLALCPRAAILRNAITGVIPVVRRVVKITNGALDAIAAIAIESSGRSTKVHELKELSGSPEPRPTGATE